MPDFSKAEVTAESQDLTAYRTFLKRLVVGQTVTLPLEPGETTRKVMRALNSAAEQSNMRLARLASESTIVRFRVLAEEKRQVNLTEDAKRARVEKARVTRAANRAGIQDETTGMDVESSLPGESFAQEPSGAEVSSQNGVPPEQQVQEAEITEEAAPARPARRRASKVAQHA